MKRRALALLMAVILSAFSATDVWVTSVVFASENLIVEGTENEKAYVLAEISNEHIEKTVSISDKDYTFIEEWSDNGSRFSLTVFSMEKVEETKNDTVESNTELSEQRFSENEVNNNINDDTNEEVLEQPVFDLKEDTPEVLTFSMEETNENTSDEDDYCEINGHNWGTQKQVWERYTDETNTSIPFACTTTRICKNNPSHVITERTENVVITQVKAPTCTGNGGGNGKAYFENPLLSMKATTIVYRPLGHDPVCTGERVEVTCTKDGFEPDYICSRCDLVIYKGADIPANGHELNENNICEKCGCKKTELFSTTVDCKLEVVKEADCVNEGTGKYVAEINYPNELKEILKDYSSFEKEVTLLALGHDFGDFTVVKEPTCVDEGLKKKVCRMCSCEVTEAMKALGHTVNKNARCSICKEKVGKVVKETSGEKAMVRFTADEIKSLDNFSEYGFTRLSEATTIETDRYTLKLEEGVILEADYEENLNTIIKGVEDVTGFTFTDKIIIYVGNYDNAYAISDHEIKIPWCYFCSCCSSYPSTIIHELVHLTSPYFNHFTEGYPELYEDIIMDYLGGKYKAEETTFTNMLAYSRNCGVMMDGLTEETFKSVFFDNLEAGHEYSYWMAKFVSDTYGPQKIIDYYYYCKNRKIEAKDFSHEFELQILNSFFDCDFLHDYYEWAKRQPYLYEDALEEYLRNNDEKVYYDFSDSGVIIPRPTYTFRPDTIDTIVNFSKDVTIDCAEAIAYFQACGLDIKGVGIFLVENYNRTYTIDYYDKNGNLLYHEPASTSNMHISRNIGGATTIKLTNINKDADSHSRFHVFFDASYIQTKIKNAYYLPYEGAYDNTIFWSDDNSKCTYKALRYDGLDDVEVTVDTVSEVILEPTCINDGTIKYTATFDLKDELKEDNVQTKEEKIPALGHKLDESFVCSVCGYIDSEAKEKALKEKEAEEKRKLEEEQRKLEEEQKEANDRILRGVCKVSFETGCELNVSSYELDKNSSLGTTPVLTRNGYTFNGWYIGNKKAIESYPVKSDLTLTAKWTANKYFIKYNLNGGKAKTTAYYKTGTSTTLPTPTKKGYVFTCYDVFSLTGVVEDNTVTADSYGDITLSANYRPISYTINYHINDTVTSKTYLYDENIDMISDFINLSDDKSIIAFTKGKTTYSVNKTYTNLATSDGAVIDLYAKLGAKGYYINYLNTDDCKFSNAIRYYKENSSVSLTKPTKTGYVFKGFTDEAGNTVTKIVKGTNKNLTLTASWEPVSYNVKINGNFKESEPLYFENLAYDNTQSFTNTFVREGYTFLGFNTKSNGTGTYLKDNGGSYSLSKLANKKTTVNIYAIWKANSYKITYSGISLGDIYKNVSEVTVGKSFSPGAAKRVGFTFKGYTVSEGASVSYKKNTDFVNKVNADNTLDLTLTPVFEENEYSIKISSNGGVNDNKKSENKVYTKTSYTTVNDLTNVSKLYSKNGYHFKGLALDSKGKKMITDISKVSKLSPTNKKTVQLYVIWERG